MEIEVVSRDKEFTTLTLKKKTVYGTEEIHLNKNLVVYRQSGGPIIFDSVGDYTTGWREYLVGYVTRTREYHEVSDKDLAKFLGDFKTGGYQSY